MLGEKQSQAVLVFSEFFNLNFYIILDSRFFHSLKKLMSYKRSDCSFLCRNISSLAHPVIPSLGLMHNYWIIPFFFPEVACLIKSTSRCSIWVFMQRPLQFWVFMLMQEPPPFFFPIIVWQISFFCALQQKKNTGDVFYRGPN